MFKYIRKSLGIRKRTRRNKENDDPDERSQQLVTAVSCQQDGPARLPYSYVSPQSLAMLIDSRLAKKVFLDFDVVQPEYLESGSFGHIYKVRSPSNQETVHFTVLKVLQAQNAANAHCQK